MDPIDPPDLSNPLSAPATGTTAGGTSLQRLVPNHHHHHPRLYPLLTTASLVDSVASGKNTQRRRFHLRHRRRWSFRPDPNVETRSSSAEYNDDDWSPSRIIPNDQFIKQQEAILQQIQSQISNASPTEGLVAEYLQDPQRLQEQQAIWDEIQRDRELQMLEPPIDDDADNHGNDNENRQKELTSAPLLPAPVSKMAGSSMCTAPPSPDWTRESSFSSEAPGQQNRNDEEESVKASSKTRAVITTATTTIK